MPQAYKLSELINSIESIIQQNFGGKVFWIKAEITDVKKQADKRWCFLKFIEKEGNNIVSEIKAVFWNNSYFQIENFERETFQSFESGLEITCQVKVRFHKKFGLDLEVLAIDYAYALGQLELERKQILAKLIAENEQIILSPYGNYFTPNNQADLSSVIQNIALITAPNSDGERDFMRILESNQYGYQFNVTPFLTQVQGEVASEKMLAQLEKIEKSKIKFDAVVLIRGGGSDTDFKSFNNYELAKKAALFATPIITGIGHDRNTSIVDLMVRQKRTPTEVANFIIDYNYNFEYELLLMKQQLDQRVEFLLHNAHLTLQNYEQRIKNLNPKTLLKKGFAIIYQDNKIVTNPDLLAINSTTQTQLKDQLISSTIHEKKPNL